MPRYDISIRVAATRYTVTEAKPKLEPKALFLRICGLFCELHGLRVGVCDSYLLLSADISRSARTRRWRSTQLWQILKEKLTYGVTLDCHHYILFLSLCRHVFDAFSCNIHHEERYLKFADISFENIDTAKKYRDNIDTFLRRYPSPNY